MTEHEPVNPRDSEESQAMEHEEIQPHPESEDIQNQTEIEIQPAGPKEKKSPGFLETIYGVFFSPVAAFEAIAENPPVGQAVLFFLIVQMLSLINGVAMVREQFPNLLGSAFISFLPIMILAMALIGWFFNASVLQLLAEFLGGKGRGRQLFTALGFTYAPSLFSAPVSLLIGENWPRAANLLTFALTVWVVVLTVLAVRSVHGLSTGKSIWTVLIPFISIVLLVLGMTLFTILVIMGMGLTEFPLMPGM